jgi:hypothetical protein
MRTPFDQFQKAFLAAFLEFVGRTEVEREVPSQIQSIDVSFEPDERARMETRLGVLGRMVADGTSMIECFSRPPGSQQIDDCVRKQLVLHQELILRARRNDIEHEVTKPRLWILSSGRPEKALQALETSPMQGWPAGFLQARDHDRLHVVVLRDLPLTHETLLLRCLGRGATLRRAWNELAALPQGAFASVVAMPLLLAFQTWITQDSKEDRIMTFLQQLRDRYAEMQQQAMNQGRAEGLRDTLREQLTERFGALPEDIDRRIADAQIPELQQWLKRVLRAPTLTDVLH